MSNRSDKFVYWLKDGAPEKVNLLVSLERAARMISHVKMLTGDIDEKLVLKLVGVSEEIRKHYESVEMDAPESREEIRENKPG